MRILVVFLCCFLGGAGALLVARAAAHRPHAAPAPTAMPVTGATPPASAPSGTTAVINTICPVCGMEVDHDIPAVVWQGRRIGLGCATCPARFAKDPDRYGPFALANGKAPAP